MFASIIYNLTGAHLALAAIFLLMVDHTRALMISHFDISFLSSPPACLSQELKSRKWQFVVFTPHVRNTKESFSWWEEEKKKTHFKVKSSGDKRVIFCFNNSDNFFGPVGFWGGNWGETTHLQPVYPGDRITSQCIRMMRAPALALQGDSCQIKMCWLITVCVGGERDEEEIKETEIRKRNENNYSFIYL